MGIKQPLFRNKEEPAPEPVGWILSWRMAQENPSWATYKVGDVWRPAEHGARPLIYRTKREAEKEALARDSISQHWKPFVAPVYEVPSRGYEND